MEKKVEDLTIEEAKKVITDLMINKKLNKLKILTAKNEEKLRSTEKRLLKEKKSKRLKSLQTEINIASTKSAKDLKRKNKIRETNSFDSQISAKDSQIDQIKMKI